MQLCFSSSYRPFGSCHATSSSNPDTSGLDKPMWEWLQNANYSGVKKFRQNKVNTWTYTVKLELSIAMHLHACPILIIVFLLQQNNVTSTFYSLGVSRNNPNRPVFLFEMNTYYTYRRNVTVFAKYKAGPPHERIFAVPKVCMLN